MIEAAKSFQKVEVSGALFAYLHECARVTILEVYRSVQVRVTGALYAPVSEYLASHPHEELCSTEFEDKNMMCQRAIRTLYKMGEGEARSKHAA